MKKILAWALAAGLCLTALAGCQTDRREQESSSQPQAGVSDTEPEEPQAGTTVFGPIAAEQLQVGFVYFGSPEEDSLTAALDAGRQALEAQLGVTTQTAEHTASQESCAEAVRTLTQGGCQVIVAGSGQLEPWIEAAAGEYPEVVFLQLDGSTVGENLAPFSGRMQEPEYLAGMAAGLKTQTGRIGYLAYAPSYRNILLANAFALGVQAANPEATVELIWTGAWYDPDLERSAALELLDRGCDVLGQELGSTAALQAAAQRGAWAVGSGVSGAEAAADAYLTAPVWDFSGYLTGQVQRIIDGSWTSARYEGGLAEGLVALDALSANCAEGTAEQLQTAQEALAAGTLEIFSGPLYDNQGKLRLGEGETMTAGELARFDWFVDGIVGTIPSLSSSEKEATAPAEEEPAA